MENLRRYDTWPFQYRGGIVNAVLYYKGNSDLVHSWDIMLRGLNLSKATREERLEAGFTDDDMEKMNVLIQSHVDHKEGRR